MELETIKQIIKKQIDIDTSNITMDTTFEDLQIDSLDLAEIVMDIEEAFDISIETGDGLKTVADLVDYIKNNK